MKIEKSFFFEGKRLNMADSSKGCKIYESTDEDVIIITDCNDEALFVVSIEAFSGEGGGGIFKIEKK